MQLLRDNKDTLMSVLDAFIHDPLVEWEDEKRKKVSPMYPHQFLRISYTLCPGSRECEEEQSWWRPPRK